MYKRQAITAGAAGIEISDVIQQGMPLYWVMAIVTIGVAFYGLRKDIKKGKFDNELQAVEHEEITEFDPKAKIATFMVLTGFVLDLSLIHICIYSYCNRCFYRSFGRIFWRKNRFIFIKDK